MTKKKDMRKRDNKQHLGTAANRDEYEQKKSVVIKSSKPIKTDDINLDNTAS